MVNQQRNDEGLRELALFAGAGGGILGGHLLGWRTVCAVEYNAYARSVLLARQNDGTFPPFPVWDDVRTFDGKPWRGIVDVVSGGFPCQDISVAGNGAGLDGERSGLWSEMARIIGEVRPRYAFIENSPMLIDRGLDRVLCDLAKMGFDAEWGVLSAADTGAPHLRERIWVVAHAQSKGRTSGGAASGHSPDGEVFNLRSCDSGSSLANADREHAYGCGIERENGRSEPTNGGSTQLADSVRVNEQRIVGSIANPQEWSGSQQRQAGSCGYGFGSWPVEPALGRVVDGLANRADQLKAIGNGQVPRVAATAWEILTGE